MTHKHETDALKQAKELEALILDNEKEIEADLLQEEAKIDPMWAGLLRDSIMSLRQRLEVVHTFMKDEEAPRFPTMRAWVEKKIAHMPEGAIKAHYNDVRALLQKMEISLVEAVIKAQKKQDVEKLIQAKKGLRADLKAKSKKELVEELSNDPDRLQEYMARPSFLAAVRTKATTPEQKKAA